VEHANLLSKLKMLFVQSRRNAKRRVRDEHKCKISDRKPLTGWLASFFADGYIESLVDFQWEKLHVSQKDFPLYDMQIDLDWYLQKLHSH
jgi:hypothetical protein